ncbi:LOW QUALITY PROTEIN: dual specificity protein phosphatase 13 [Anarrhichthys ocellatus]|uniref:LOW QUALITY PROTEIN: dual specificity protein phosphatase 13 n=1 Tax=Anarrhichthys ocellatus TaxID=433405 RepID=UPI0012ED1E8C|nr:LOW QUALITY PROTEIN: dual specificity protein phosphatase 13-like [Anarrhichthys ocellatus]
MTVRGCSSQSKGNRQQQGNNVVLHHLNLGMTDTQLFSEVRCDGRDSEQRTASNTDPEEEEECSCATEDSKRTWTTPSLQELEEVLHSAPRSCRHRDEVWPNLYLGDMVMSHDRLGLWQLGITHVLNAAHGKLCCKGSDGFYGTTVRYYGVPANDLPTFDLSPFFHPAAEFIHQALTSGGKVFVHCAVGVSRSAALVLAYLMIHHQLSLLSSTRCVQQKRWIFPNRGFLGQLIALDRRLQGEGSNEAK